MWVVKSGRLEEVGKVRELDVERMKHEVGWKRIEGTRVRANLAANESFWSLCRGVHGGYRGPGSVPGSIWTGTLEIPACSRA